MMSNIVPWVAFIFPRGGKPASRRRFEEQLAEITGFRIVQSPEKAKRLAMTTIRISGFQDRNELRRQLDELPDEARAGESSDEESVNLRAAQIELSWLRKEIAELDDRLSIASGRTGKPVTRQHRFLRWISAAALLGAGVTVSRLSKMR